VLGTFKIGTLKKKKAWGWLGTLVPLIFASRVARIIGMSHWFLTGIWLFKKTLK
jgi:hypothetical protein